MSRPIDYQVPRRRSPPRSFSPSYRQPLPRVRAHPEREVVEAFVHEFVRDKIDEIDVNEIETTLDYLNQAVEDGVIAQALYELIEIDAKNLLRSREHIKNYRYLLIHDPEWNARNLKDLLRQFEIYKDRYESKLPMVGNFYKPEVNNCNSYPSTLCPSFCSLKDDKCEYPYDADSYKNYWASKQKS
jgi:hypothetical protein